MRRALPILASAAALTALTALTAPDAHANGRFPSAQHVVIGPGTRSDVIALRATFGVLLSTDGGSNFRWLCEEALFYPLVPSMNFDAPIEISSNGRLVWGYEDGIRHTADPCNFTQSPDTAAHIFADLTATPSGNVLFAIESGQGAANAVYRGDGDTARFTRMGAGVNNVLFDTIEVAPSDPTRIYVTGRDTNTFLPVFYRSDNGGATLVPVVADGAVADSLWVSGVDPRDPNVLYARANVGLLTELRRSRNAGDTWQRLITTRDPMLGFAMSDDGRTLWVGSIAEGLLRSDDGGDTFRQVNQLPVICLRQHAGTLWACSDWINQVFALGRSRDQGQTFEPVLTFSSSSNFGPPTTCAARSEGAQICVERWPLLVRSLVPPPDDRDASVRPDVARRDAAAPRPDVSMDAADATIDAPEAAVADAGSVVPPTPPRCGCSVPGRADGGGGCALVLAFCLAVSRRRQRGASGGA